MAQRWANYMAISSRGLSPDLYTCSFPGCPAPVSIHISLVETLQGIVRDTSGDQQGILYGQPGAAGTVVQSSRALTAFGKEELRLALAEPRDPVVGYYRIREGKHLELTTGEIDLASTFFSDPGSVILLVLRRAGGPEANFFCLEHGAFLNLPLLEFPLDSAGLTQRDAPRIRRMVEEVAAPAFPEFPPPSTPSTSPPTAANGKPAPVGMQVARMRIIPIVAFVAVVFLCAALFFYRPLGRIGNEEAVRSTPIEGGTSLRAEWHGEDLKIIWDSDSPAVANATSGVLDINDGGTTRQIPMTSYRVRYGSLLYSPMSEQISVRLTTTFKDRHSTAQMSVLLKRPLQPQSSPGPVAINSPIHNAPIHNALIPGYPSPKIPFEVKTESQAATRPFIPPAGNREMKPPAELEDFPAVRANLERFDLPATLPLGTMAPPSAVSAPRSEPTKPREEEYVGPVLIAQGGVRAPRELLPILTQPVAVSVRISVNEAGRITQAEAIPEKGKHALLLAAATDAAWRCRFQPARRGKSPVSSSITIVFHIGPEQK